MSVSEVGVVATVGAGAIASPAAAPKVLPLALLL